MKQLVTSFWSDESGQGLTEYGLILALIALAVLGILILFREELQRIWNAILGGIQNVESPVQTS